MRSLLTFVTSVAIATGALSGVAVPATTTTAFGSGISGLEVVTNTAPFNTNSATYVSVTGAVATITVKESGFIRARFSAESRCGGEGAKGDICSMRVLVVGGANFNPKSGLDFAFDSYDGVCCTDVLPEAHAMEWISGPMAAGTYTVRAQASAQNSITFTLDDWTYSVEAIDP
jgi:hypothetical protein